MIPNRVYTEKIIRRKNMKTKIICLVVALVTSIFALASCAFLGGGNGGEGGSDYTGSIEGVNWNKTTVIFELTKNSNSDELSSGCERYYAGASTGNYDTIDQSIKARNAEAYKQANVEVSYLYVSNEKTYGWGENIDRIFLNTQVGGKYVPDMYCNFVHDMVCASIRGAFANLYSTAYGNGGNFFRFTKGDYNKGNPTNYFDSEAGEGYFYSYMESLTLSPNKMYCLASNYSTDLVRAFLVVPVNIEMMNNISLEASTGDMTGDQKFDFRDFYKLVWNGKWNYDALAKYSAAVYEDTNKNTADSDAGSANLGDKLGFAAGTSSGLTASGILYTSSVKIINKTVNADGSWTFTYPATNTELNSFATALYNLFTDGASKGIVAVSSDAANAFSGTSDGDLRTIRNEFAKNNVLFGGVIAVGSLEDTVYQNMRANGKGFGIVPVPVYKDGDTYQTLVHNIGKVISISATTTEFEQCSAFLDYQSRNSSEILDMYYDEQLASAVEGEASSDNKQMLTYIRNHVRDCFDKTYEDVIADFMSSTDSTATENKWHTALMRAGYRVSDLSAVYNGNYAKKAGDLNKIITAWNDLP